VGSWSPVGTFSLPGVEIRFSNPRQLRHWVCVDWCTQSILIRNKHWSKASNIY